MYNVSECSEHLDGTFNFLGDEEQLCIIHTATELTN